jgi:hypothetical protein
MLLFLKNRRLFDLKSKFYSCVKGIPRDALDGDAKELIREEVWKLPRLLAWDGNCEAGQPVGMVDPGLLSSPHKMW